MEIYATARKEIQNRTPQKVAEEHRNSYLCPGQAESLLNCPFSEA